MGIIYRGVNPKLALDLKEKYNLRFFVETGTHVGNTAMWASSRFEKVFTAELDPTIYDKAIFNTRSCGNVKIFNVDSREWLGEVLRKLPGLALIWLDGHWSPDLGYPRPETPCPVLEEIELIAKERRRHVIMVDDVRLFGREPGWPELDKVREDLSYYGRDVLMIDDVLISIPVG